MTHRVFAYHFQLFQAYLVTHLVFVASSWGGTSWGALPLPRTLFAEELVFLSGNVSTVLEMNDPELVGEFLHCLRLFQVHEDDMHIRIGVSYLLDVEARWCAYAVFCCYFSRISLYSRPACIFDVQ